MADNLPEETRALLRAIANQPDHKIMKSDLPSLEIPEYKERLSSLVKLNFVKETDLKSFSGPGFVGFEYTSVTTTAAGLDELKEEKSLLDQLHAAQEALKRSEEKAEYWKTKYKELKDSKSRKTVIITAVSDIISAAVGAFVTFLLK